MRVAKDTIDLQRRLSQSPFRHCLLDEEAEPDVRSRSGFDDDEMVVSLVNATGAEGLPNPHRDGFPGKKEMAYSAKRMSCVLSE